MTERNNWKITFAVIIALFGVLVALTISDNMEKEQIQKDKLYAQDHNHTPVKMQIVGKSIETVIFQDIGQNKYSEDVSYTLYGLEDGKNWGPSYTVSKEQFDNTEIGDYQEWDPHGGGPFKWTNVNGTWVSG